MADLPLDVAKVVRVIDEYKIVINKGSKDKINSRCSFLVYSLEGDVIDPDTQENYGPLEVVKGKGKIKHVQENITTIESAEYQELEKKVKIYKRSGNIFSLGGMPQNEEVIEPGEKRHLPFENPKVGDFVKIMT